MWPFKKKVKAPEPMKAPSPCGDDSTHYLWEDDQKMPCPRCHYNALKARELKSKRQQNEELAELIATKVAYKIKGR